MAALETIKAKQTALLGKANETTGGADTNLTDAVTRLREGYDQGREPVTETLIVTENGSYIPPEGVDGFNHVDVEVDLNQEYQNGYQSGYESGYESGKASISLQEKTVNENGTVYPDPGYDGLSLVTVDVETSSGGNAYMIIKYGSITVGSNIFDGSILFCILAWYQIFESMSGSGAYYMPATVFLAFDSPIIFNGAYCADSIDENGTNQIVYCGNDITGAYRLVMVLESDASGNKLLSINVTNNGEAVEVADGLYASTYFTYTLI